MLVVADPGSEATLVETYVVVGDRPAFTNGVSEVVLGQGARLDHYQVQDQPSSAFHFTTLSA